MATPAKIIETNAPTAVLVGRVNVGKSTLFNRLTETTHALVSKIPGTTRTRNVGAVRWRGKTFQLVDTGGLTFDEAVPLEKDIIGQTETAIKGADLILFIVDLQDELLPQEKELAKKLLTKYRGKKQIILVGNKADSAADRQNIYNAEWKKLGLGEPIPVSAANGSNIGDLIDVIYKYLRKSKKRPKKITEKNALKVAIIGKPNVGKSLLFNKLIGEPRVIVSDMPHTTREPHDTLIEIDGSYIIFVDTAGIRRKTKVSGDLERQGIGKSLDAIKRANIVLFVIDAGEPITDQDKQLGGFLEEHAKSAIIVVNKWDLSEDNEDSFRNDVRQRIYKYFPHLSYAPIVFVSALTEYRVHQIFPIIERAASEKRMEIPAADLNNFFKHVTNLHKPARGKGVRHPKILSFTQIASDPPVFEAVIKHKTSLHQSYIHFLKHRLREQFGFFASPIIIKLRKVKK
ncbi:MAG: ribosome biogenesis GTPase Der [Candidatus Magasanikbacteria bacterium]|nr:ribosome biogenesis GTPase Der [Candidatus Magasanikbacteria bacterium]